MANSYNNEQFMVARDHIRKNPAMYIGGIDEAALHHLAFEVLNHAVNAALSNRCDQIEITIHDNNELSIQDNSPGIYTDPYGEDGKSFLEVFMTDVGFHLNQRDKKLHTYKVEGGLHGIGLAAINPLCYSMRVETMYRNELYEQTYHRGVPINQVAAVRRLEKGESTGTILTLQPDFTIFEINDFDYEILANRAFELAVLIPDLQIRLRDERTAPNREQMFHYQDGFGEFVSLMNQNQYALHEPFSTHHKIQFSQLTPSVEVIVDVAYQYIEGGDTSVNTYVNTVHMTDGGIHLRAFHSALTDHINEQGREFGMLESEVDLLPHEVAHGLSALISIKHPEPEFRGTNEKYLCNPEIYGAVAGAVYQTEIPNDVLQVIIKKCLANRA